MENLSPKQEECELGVFEVTSIFCLSSWMRRKMRKKCIVVEQIRLLLKDDEEEARNFMGGNGIVEALLRFLDSTLHEENAKAQESGAMALFNLTVNNSKHAYLFLEFHKYQTGPLAIHLL